MTVNLSALFLSVCWCYRPHVQTQASSEDVDTVKETARLLALDIADYMLKPSTRLKCRHAATLRRVVDELSSRHEIIFSSIARKLGSRLEAEGQTAARWRYTFVAVASELFADGHNNWGRIVTIYAFAGWLVRKHCTAETISDGIAHTIAITAGDFVADKLAEWICRQGGWVKSCFQKSYVLLFFVITSLVLLHVILYFLCYVSG